MCSTRLWKAYIHIHIRTDVRSSFAVAKGKSGSLEGGGMKREGEEGEELKLPGKERNRVGLNLLDCFQLHASSYSPSLSLYSFLSLFSFLLSRRHSS